MQTIAYISCPDIALTHLNESVARATQYWPVFPTPQQPTSSLDDFHKLVDELEEAYDEWVQVECDKFEQAYDAFLDDEDALIHRPDDDPADQPCQDGLKGWCSCDDCSEPVEEEPACGDCGGCCECLGDPEVEPRFDTLHEQEEFYRETA